MATFWKADRAVAVGAVQTVTAMAYIATSVCPNADVSLRSKGGSPKLDALHTLP